MRRIVVSAAAAAVALSLPGPPAQATFHRIQVREVYPGSAANMDAEYVELQMWTSGQDLVGGHLLHSYDASGAPVATSSFPAKVANGANQSTLVLATSQAADLFGIAPDAALEPAGELSPDGGAVCWEEIDCVSWGDFSGSLPSPAGTPASAAGIPDGMAIQRSISRACPTSLDPADDSDNSAGDFGVVSPAPRPNSVPPSELLCASGGQGGGPSSQGEDRPATVLRRKPPKRTRDRTPTFRFGSNSPGARFQCKLDRKPYRSCRSPFTSKRLAPGSHRFRVRAVDHGLADPTPASYRFRVVAG